ncbi:MAG: hypothetical protein IJ935_03065 [Afipia sp.]|nr:hypothetical protein [Afipia sp.]
MSRETPVPNVTGLSRRVALGRMAGAIGEANAKSDARTECEERQRGRLAGER